MERAGGAEAVFQALFSREYGNLCRYALTFLHDSHQAEDVVQDTFIKIWEGKRDLIASPDIKFYLITAVRNNCISVLRKLKTAGVQYTEESPEPEPEPSISAMQLREDATEQSRRIAAALDMLPPKCKEVFLLIKMQGLSYKQAADTLGISVKTVENQMGKAIRVFRENPAVQAMVLVIIFLLGKVWQSVGVLLQECVIK